MIVADSTESKHRHIDSSSAEVTVKEDIDSARTLQHYNNMTSEKTTKVRDVEQQKPPPPRPTDIKDDDDDDEDDEAPLVARSKVSPLEMESSRRRRKKFLEQEDQGNSLVWWVIRSVLMTVAAFLPVLIGFLVFGRESRGHVGKNNVDVTWDFDNNDSDDPTITPPTTVDETTTLEIERDPVVKGCEPEQSFNELMKKMEELEQFTADLCLEEFRNDKKGCKCYNPTIPTMLDQNEVILKRWKDTFQMTKSLATNATRDLDTLEVVLVGDSITEHWHGSDLSHHYDDFNGHAEVFNTLFKKENGGKVNGVTLGVAAERCANTLYRLQNGGMGDLDPDVWWVLIGTNDIGGDHCSEEVMVSGNINIVQEILSRRPNATVVINSILPRSPPIWDHLVKVNERLSCYAESTKRVEFFNATDIFLTNHTLKGLMDGLHPSPEGSQEWGSAIVEKVLEIIQKKTRIN